MAAKGVCPIDLLAHNGVICFQIVLKVSRIFFPLIYFITTV